MIKRKLRLVKTIILNVQFLPKTLRRILINFYKWLFILYFISYEIRLYRTYFGDEILSLYSHKMKYFFPLNYGNRFAKYKFDL